ncbi:MAG: hypothetical protein KAR83_05555 [Thermodesulfovibrionales bacterium]|nr:hypothetical protein [Thermodesulfovibrionales bacterium]
MNINYMLKVEDAKAADVQKALKEAGISVRSIQKIHEEDTGAEAEAQE